jgi:hypothetical protein
MTKHLALLISSGLIAAVCVAAQEPLYPPFVNPPAPKTNPTKGSKETVEQTKVTTDEGTTKTSTDTLLGKVEGYEPGKWIRVSTPGRVEGSRNIDLQGKDVTARVNSDVKTGTWVRVVERTDASARKIITVEPQKQAAARERQ